MQFPSVIDQMCQQLDWTREVGKAFTADQKGVLDSIQRLRAQAAAVGNLKSSPQQKVETKTDEGKEVITVEPADPKVVYVPQYDPQVVYVTPPTTTVVQAAPATTTVVQEDNSGDMIAAGLIGFTAGIVLNEAFDDNDDYYYPHWGGGGYPPRALPVSSTVRSRAITPRRGTTVRPHYGNTNVNINNNYYNRATNNARAVNRNTGVNTNDVRGRTEYAGAQNRAARRELERVSRRRERAQRRESTRGDLKRIPRRRECTQRRESTRGLERISRRRERAAMTRLNARARTNTAARRSRAAADERISRQHCSRPGVS